MNLCLSVVNSTPILAFFDGLGGLEMLVIFMLGLMLFGGKRLPEVAEDAGNKALPAPYLPATAAAAASAPTSSETPDEAEAKPPSDADPKADQAPPEPDSPKTDPK